MFKPISMSLIELSEIRFLLSIFKMFYNSRTKGEEKEHIKIVTIKKPQAQTTKPGKNHYLFKTAGRKTTIILTCCEIHFLGTYHEWRFNSVVLHQPAYRSIDQNFYRDLALQYIQCRYIHEQTLHHERRQHRSSSSLNLFCISFLFVIYHLFYCLYFKHRTAH